MPAFIDLTGRTFGFVSAVKRIKNGKWYQTRWLFQCECGNQFEADAFCITSGRQKSCGCKSPNRRKEMSGLTFGKWTVLSRSSRSGSAHAGKNRRYEYWECQCECGATRTVHGPSLRRGTSLGCRACVDTSGDSNPWRRMVRKKHGANYVPRENPWYRRANGLKMRARATGLEFGFSSNCECALYLMEIAPERCPVFGVKFEDGIRGRWSRNAPSVDRIRNSDGYVRGNLQVISLRANTMKTDATAEELEQFARWITSTVGPTWESHLSPSYAWH